MSHRRRFIQRLVAIAGALALTSTLSVTSPDANAQAKTVKVGVLHSLSGTMAISETVLKDVALMAFEEINAKGGVMGYKIEPVVVDPASNWPLFAEKAASSSRRTKWPRYSAAGLQFRASRCCRCSKS